MPRSMFTFCVDDIWLHPPILAGVAFFSQRGYNIEKGGGRMTKIEKLRKWVEESKRIVFFGGAGVSTELC